MFLLMSSVLRFFVLLMFWVTAVHGVSFCRRLMFVSMVCLLSLLLVRSFASVAYPGSGVSFVFVIVVVVIIVLFPALHRLVCVGGILLPVFSISSVAGLIPCDFCSLFEFAYCYQPWNLLPLSV